MTCKTISRMICPLALAMSCCVLGPLAAAPIFEAQKISDEQRAFANIKHLQIEIRPLPDALAEMGLHPKDIRKRVQAACKSAHIQITDDPSAPKLFFKADLMIDQRYPEAVGYILFIDIVQKTRIVRLDDELMLPTSTIPIYGITSRKEVTRALRDSVDEGVMWVLQVIRDASAVRARK